MSWPVLKISDFCETGSGGTPSRKKKAFYKNGSIPWVKSGELKESAIWEAEETITPLGVERSSAKIIPAGAILLAMYGANVGRLAMLEIEATTNQAVCNIRPNPDVADTEYVYRFLQTEVRSFLSKAAGGAQPNISQAIIKDTKIPLPPLAEQRRIAGILEKADAIRRKREKAIALTETLLKSVFLDMFGDPVTNPMGWDCDVLENCSNPDDRINSGVVQPGTDFVGGVPMIRSGDIGSFQVREESIKLIDPQIESSYKRSRVVGDEIFISCVGSIGGVALANKEHRGHNIARQVARIRFSIRLNRVFAAYMIASPAIQNYFTKETRTVAQPTLNISQIKKTPVYIPPIGLQEKFTNIVEKANGILSVVESSNSEIDSLLASLTQRAFRGELTASDTSTLEAAQ